MALAAQLGYIAWICGNDDKLVAVREQIGDLSAIAPQTPTETRLFDMVSITAGVCEEILYRGLLLVGLGSIFGLWPAVVLSSVIFGLGHAYQGLTGIVKTALVGLVFALFTVLSGSLIIAIVLHVAVDITSGRLMGRALRLTPQNI